MYTCISSPLRLRGPRLVTKYKQNAKSSCFMKFDQSNFSPLGSFRSSVIYKLLKYILFWCLLLGLVKKEGTNCNMKLLSCSCLLTSTLRFSSYELTQVSALNEIIFMCFQKKKKILETFSIKVCIKLSLPVQKFISTHMH